MDSFFKCPGPERSPESIPDTLTCPECAGEIEVWPDEQGRKCPTCNRPVSRIFTTKAPTSPPLGTYKVEGRERLDKSGTTIFYEHHEALVPVRWFDHAVKNKIACEACHNYGKNFACPPYSPTFMEHLAGMKFARVLCIRMPQEYYRHLVPDKVYSECFKAAKSILDKELLGYRKQGSLIAGSGYCNACEKCAAEQEHSQCIQPDLLIYSLESLGVNLTGLTSTCFDIDLEWSAHDHAADFVCAIGAVFYPALPA